MIRYIHVNERRVPAGTDNTMLSGLDIAIKPPINLEAEAVKFAVGLGRLDGSTDDRGYASEPLLLGSSEVQTGIFVPLEGLYTDVEEMRCYGERTAELLGQLGVIANVIVPETV